jgi:hypothetical protein
MIDPATRPRVVRLVELVDLELTRKPHLADVVIADRVLKQMAREASVAGLLLDLVCLQVATLRAARLEGD